jgi:hypothetical protein
MTANRKITKTICCVESAKRAGSSAISRIIGCTVCARLVRMVTPEVATVFTRIDVEKLKPRIDNHPLHSTRTQTGSLLICLESLSETL